MRALRDPLAATAGQRSIALHIFLLDLAFLLSLAVTIPTLAEQTSLPRIAAIIPSSGAHERALREELQERGYVDGRNVRLDFRLYRTYDEAVQRQAKELVASKPDVIVAYGTPAARALLDATSTIPIVFAVGDPVASGLVSNLVRPGKNATGMSVMALDLAPKAIEVLLQIAPEARKIVAIRNRANPIGVQMVEAAQAAGRGVGIQIEPVDVRSVSDLEAAVPAIRRSRADAIFIHADLSFQSDRQRVVRAILATGLPAVFQDHVFTEAGGLMSYGHNNREATRIVVSYVDRILKGAKPGELPVEQATKVRLVINMKAAKELGINIPQALLLRADEVIQ